jgi:hypothetical protein
MGRVKNNYVSGQENHLNNDALPKENISQNRTIQSQMSESSHPTCTAPVDGAMS